MRTPKSLGSTWLWRGSLICLSLAALVASRASAQFDSEPVPVPLPDWALDPPVQFEFSPQDSILYRPLRKGDFRASAPPPGFKEEEAARIGALTCAVILLHLELQAKDVTVGPFETNEEVEAWLETADLEYLRDHRIYEVWPAELRFEARFDQRCSFWNRRNELLPEDYVLLHEQTHFAIVELVARQFNADLDAVREQLSARGPSIEAATAELRGRFRDVLAEADAAQRELNNQLDLDTSGRLNWPAQRAWAERIDAELSALAPGAVSAE